MSGNGTGRRALAALLLAATLFAATGAGAAEDPAGSAGNKTCTLAELEKTVKGKPKAEVVGLLGPPDRMYGVMDDGEEVPINLSARWVYAPPKAVRVTGEPGGPPCAVLHVRFDANDRVLSLSCDF